MELLNLVLLVVLTAVAASGLIFTERTAREARRVRVRIPIRVEEPRIRRRHES
ncbi:MAG: hypothetical protein M3Q29_13850 [Chloroflexota bacterium]|nr:hypothetical protein [Chloroflexota bacterium]